MEYHSGIKKNEIMPFTATCNTIYSNIYLEIIILGEVKSEREI